MTALLVGLTVAVALLALLVAGLLRANAEAMRALHQLGVNLGPDVPGGAPRPEPADGADVAVAVPATSRPTPRRPDPSDVIDLGGVTPLGDAISVPVSGVRHDTLVGFLTSGCQTCRRFWEAFREGPPDVPGGARFVVVTRGPEAESPGTIASLGGWNGVDGGVPVVMSSELWEHYDVPFAPYFVYVSGPAGRVVGEGVAAGWEEVRNLVSSVVVDGTTAPPPASVGRPRSRSDRERDAAVDRHLSAAGIRPGDPRLHHPTGGDLAGAAVTSVARPVTAFGLAVAPPAGWEIAIFRRPPAHGQRTYSVLHAATVPLPPVRGDYGSGVVERLGADDVFVSILEFGPESVRSPLFAALRGVPGLTPDAYRPQQLQRTILGQAGVQRFFNAAGRAFCLYSVIGSIANRIALTPRANELIGSLRIEAQ